MLNIQFFGHFHISMGEEPLPFNAPPRTLPLLAYLLLHRNEPLPRQSLSFTLWPEESEESARANLRRHLHWLRKSLPAPPAGRPWLLSDAKSLQWNPEAEYHLDVAEFERLSAMEEGQLQAIELYQGDLLNDLYDDWILSERERLCERYFECLDRLVQRCRLQRDYPRAIAFARQWLTHDPLREDVLRQLVSLRYESGDRAGAIEEYENFRQHLHAELGVSPMPETITLFEAVLRQESLPQFAEAPSPSAPLPASVSPAFSLPFVGREGEMQTLQARWRDAYSGRGGLVLISGEAGIGKTRLTSEFALIVESRGGRVLHGAVSPSESTPYQPLLMALRGALPMLAAVEMDPLWLSTVSLVLPELLARHPSSSKWSLTLPRLDPQRERQRLFEALARCLEALAYPRPVLLILEDLHWAGTGTLALVEYLTRRAIRHPLLIVGTYRDERAQTAHPLHELRRLLQSENLLADVCLGPLSEGTVEAIVAQWMTQESTNKAWLKRLHAVSGGNPFFLRELLRDMLSQAAFQSEESVQRVFKSIEEFSLPGTITRVVTDRLARLSNSARALAEVAAVIGPAFDIDLVCRVGGWREAEMLTVLEELLDQQILQEAVGGGRFDFIFTHDLIYDALYRAMPEPLRKRRHHRAGHVLEELRGGELETLSSSLALHFSQGGEPERAASYYERAARHSSSMYADEEALMALQQALDLTRQPKRQFALLALREEIYHRRGERQAQAQDLERLTVIANELDQNDLHCEVLQRRIRYHAALGERESQKESIDALKEYVARSDQLCRRAQAWLAEATYHSLCGEYEQARSLADQALTAYQELKDQDGQISIYVLLTDLSTQLWDFLSLQETLKQLTALTQGHPDQGILVKTLRAASGVVFSRQEFETSFTLGEQMLDLCCRIGDREGEADACSRLAAASARLFRVQEAQGYYDRAASLYAQVGKRQGLGAVLLNRGMFDVNLGQLSEALESFDQAAVIFVELNDLRGQALCALNRSAASIYQGDYQAAKVAAQHSLKLSRQLGLGQIEALSLGNLGESSLRLGNSRAAIRRLRQAVALRRKRGIPLGDSGSDLSVLIEAFVAAGESQQIREVIQELQALLESVEQNLPYPQYAMWAIAFGYQALGEPGAARSFLSKAHDVLQDRAAAIPEGPFKTSFLNMFYNRRILETHETNGGFAPLS